MRVLILTTDTLHHSWFAHRLQELGHAVHAIAETGSLSFPFDTAHPFEVQRDEYERELWFGGEQTALADVVPTSFCGSVNEESSHSMMEAFGPEAVVLFGTGIVREPLILRFGDRLFNLHGGDPERYRGLDTHLWAIYHSDFEALVTCLHRVASQLDTGDIVQEGALALRSGMELHELRAENTRVCVNLVGALLATMEKGLEVSTRSQKQKGRYYSAMPVEMKQLCLKRFQKYTSKIL